MRIGSYIRYFLYRDKGEKIYRYGIVINIYKKPLPILANIFLHPTQHFTCPSTKIIKMHLLELISEPR